MISVITITFNNYEELVETLDSIKGVDNIQSVVINGGSCEKTKALLANYNGVALSEPDKGISDAFNKGIKLSTGKAVMFLNSGDKLIEKSYLDEVNALLNSQPEIDYFYSDIIYNDSMTGSIRINVGEKDKNIARGMPYPHQSLIVTKKVFDAIGGFDLNLKIAMDFDLVLRMFAAGFTKKRYIPIASVCMDGSGVSSKQELRCIQETKYLLKKYNHLNVKNSLRINFSIFLHYLKKNKQIKIISKRLRHKVNF